MEQNPSVQPIRGREEVRAALLRPALLQLRQRESRAAELQVLHDAGLSPSHIDRDTVWTSLQNFLKVLHGIHHRLGSAGITDRSNIADAPEVVGLHLRLLRQAIQPKDAYRLYCSSFSEHLRVGTLELEESADAGVRLRYSPNEDTEEAQADPLFTAFLLTELTYLPMLWGLPQAEVEQESCISEGDLTSVFLLKWKRPWPHFTPLAALACGIGSGTAVLGVGTPWAALTSGLVSSVLAGAAAHLWTRQQELTLSRQREKNRVLALEFGLEQRGQFQSIVGDISGTVIGDKYRILHRVGSGGIGTVYAAEHLGLGMQVAVKLLKAAAAADASEAARLRREARVQMAMEHPNIVRTFDLDQMPDGSLYVVMELLQGFSLQEHLRTSSPTAPGQAIPLFLQACRGLSAAHRLGVVHRDLKPGNIFLCDSGTVKVLDFGMSKLAEEDALTQDGYTLGTPEYMSPEQCSGGTVDQRSDIYTFGILMYETLTGMLPFPNTSRQAMLQHHQRTKPTTLQQARPDLNIPQSLDEIVLSCLKKNASDRPQTAQSLERLLATVHPGSVVHEYPPETPRIYPNRP
ncbi:MAG: serine/threonine protein kinase [Polyangiaceae bacterium]|nr:serine/threonine protein kinase [Polyangiaceae bacterium]